MKTQTAYRKNKSPAIDLHAPGWTDQARRALAGLIKRGAGKRLPVVLDFDNTIVCGDIGEATLAVLVRKGILAADKLPQTLSPDFFLPEGKQVMLESGPDLTSYYEAFLAPTVHGKSDPTPLANSYAWAVEIMVGLTPLQVVRATQEAFAQSKPGCLQRIEVTPGKTSFPAPFFYPEMVELIAELRRNQFDVWIVSASNVWSVRWMVSAALNPLLQAGGVDVGIPPDHVIGVSTLLQDDKGHLYKDAVLARENLRYAALDETVLSSVRLTSRLQFPVPTYGGKVGCIWEALGRHPYLGVGDSPGDHPMLTFCENRLWIARMDKPAYQQKFVDCVAQTGKMSWIAQPVLSQEIPGFLSRFENPGTKNPVLRKAFRQSHTILEKQGENRR